MIFNKSVESLSFQQSNTPDGKNSECEIYNTNPLNQILTHNSNKNIVSNDRYAIVQMSTNNDSFCDNRIGKSFEIQMPSRYYSIKNLTIIYSFPTFCI